MNWQKSACLGKDYFKKKSYNRLEVFYIADLATSLDFCQMNNIQVNPVTNAISRWYFTDTQLDNDILRTRKSDPLLFDEKDATSSFLAYFVSFVFIYCDEAQK